MIDKIGIVEFLRRIGDDNIKFQNLASNMTNIQLVRKGKATQITFLTDPNFITPNDVAHGGGKYIGLVLWLPRDLVDKAKGI